MYFTVVGDATEKEAWGGLLTQVHLDSPEPAYLSESQLEEYNLSLLSSVFSCWLSLYNFSGPFFSLSLKLPSPQKMKNKKNTLHLFSFQVPFETYKYQYVRFLWNKWYSLQVSSSFYKRDGNRVGLPYLPQNPPIFMYSCIKQKNPVSKPMEGQTKAPK